MKNSESNSNGKILFGIGAGLIAGGILGYFFASDEGKRLRTVAADKFSELEGEVKKVLNEQNEVIAEKLKAVAETSGDLLNEAKEKMTKKIGAAEDMVENTTEAVNDNFEKGVKKAKAKIKAHKAVLNGSEA